MKEKYKKILKNICIFILIVAVLFGARYLSDKEERFCSEYCNSVPEMITFDVIRNVGDGHCVCFYPRNIIIKEIGEEGESDEQTDLLQNPE